jgi:hypothetical protein
MIAHVAAADEGRGRVVLWLGSSAQTSASAIEAAMLLARAFQSEVESLFVEDRQLFDLADFPFARAIASDEEGWRAMPREDLERELRFVGAALQRQVADAARRASIVCRSRVVRDNPLDAVAKACAENGPWNVVAIAEPLGTGDEKRLAQVFANVLDTTGVVVAGPLARRTRGPVVVTLEQFERVGPMLRAAERLAGVTGGSVRLMLVGDRRDELAWLEGEVRLLFGDNKGPALETVLTARGDVVPVAEAVRRHKGGFVLAQYGGHLVSQETSLRPLAAALECPLLLVR